MNFVKGCIIMLFGLLFGLLISAFLYSAKADELSKCIPYDGIESFAHFSAKYMAYGDPRPDASWVSRFEGQDAQAILKAFNEYGEPTNESGTEVWVAVSRKVVWLWAVSADKPVCTHGELSLSAWLEILKLARGSPV